MRTLIVTHYFPPEVGAPQARLSELAAAWTHAGDEVCILTPFPNHPTGIVPPVYRGRWRMVEGIDGYRVVRTWVYATPNEGVIRKTIGHLSFMISSVLLGARRAGRTDVVVVSSPTFFSILSAWLIARIRRARLVVEVRDLWPAIFVELGVLKSGLIIKLLEWIELASYRAADAVVVVSEGFRENIVGRGIPRHKVHFIPNGVDLNRFRNATAPTDGHRERLGGSAENCLILYAGAHGISHALTSVADAAARLSDEPVRFAFVGEGAAKAQLAEYVRELGLKNVTLLPAVPHEEVPNVLAAADVCLAPLRDVPLFSTFIPSKIFEYLAAGKAVIAALRGEAADIVLDAGGIVVPPEDPEALARAVRDLVHNPSRRASMGAAGRAFVSQNYDRAELARRYRLIFSQLMKGTSEP